MNPSLRGQPDETLMQRLQAGETDALAALFDRHYRLVLTVAHRILRDRAEAEDLMQEVFLEIFQDAHKYDASRGSVKTWVLQYAYHRSLNRKRYLRLRGFYETPRKAAPRTERPNVMSLSEWRSAISTAAEQLTEKERQAVHLTCLEGLDLKEAAGRLGESLPNLRNHYYRGLKKLRSLLFKERPAVKETAHVKS